MYVLTYIQYTYIFISMSVYVYEDEVIQAILILLKYVVFEKYSMRFTCMYIYIQMYV